MSTILGGRRRRLRTVATETQDSRPPFIFVSPSRQIKLVPSHVRFAMIPFVSVALTPRRDDPLVSNNPGELLSVAEVAAELKVTEATVRRWINQDKLVARRLAGGEFRVLRADLDAMMGILSDPPRQPRSKRPFATTAERMHVR